MAWSQPQGILQQVGLRVVPTSSDGHCLLHALRRSWQVQVGTPVPSMEVILSEVHREALVNNGRYKHFFCGPFPLYKQQMYNYLYNKVFDLTFVDLVPLILCNSMNIGLCIYNEGANGNFDFIDVVPSDSQPPRHIIHVHRKCKHYSALEFGSFRSPSPPSPPARAAATTAEWSAVSSRRSASQRVAEPSHDLLDPVVVQNRFSGLDDEEFPVLPPKQQPLAIEKASRHAPKKRKQNKPHTMSVNKSNLLNVKQTKVKTVAKAMSKKDVIVIGTSLVRDVSSKLNCDKLNVLSYTNAGCSIRHIHPRIKDMIPSNFDGALVLQMGGNDCSDNDSEYVVNAYESLLNDIKMYVPNADIFVSAVPPRRGGSFLDYKIRNVNKFLHFRSMFDEKITFIECPVFDERLHFRKDGVHFSTYGRAIYVSNMKQILCQNFHVVPLRRNPR